jgi:hypothetical protein
MGFLHVVLDGIEIWTVSRPVNHITLSVSQKVLDTLTGATHSSSLEERCRVLKGHERDQVVHEDRLIHLSVHCCILGEEIESPMPTRSRKAPPDHDRNRVLHGFHREFAVEPVGADGPPHHGSGGSDAAESRLI